MNLMHPIGKFYKRWRDLENTIDYAVKIDVDQQALSRNHPSLYDVEVHAGILAFNLRIISRKIDAVIIEFRRSIRPGHRGGVSERTIGLQHALQEYNAAVACRDACDISIILTRGCLQMAQDCFDSLNDDLRVFHEGNP